MAKQYTADQVHAKKDKAVQFLRDAVGDDDKAHLLTASPSESLRDKLKLAVRMCPRQAIALKEG